MQAKVNVLISTYNGEKYIKDQINSIQEQTYKNIKIYVRDDGSSDGTVEILRTLSEAGQIVLFEGENIGYGKSFFWLLQKAGEGKYWAFCDQDDIWRRDKIKWAVQWMESQDGGKPLLFHSAYELVNEDLSETIGAYKPPKYKINFRRALTDSVYQGFSIVMNSELRKMMLRCNIENIISHDWMAGLIVEKFGLAEFDGRIASSHRRLKESASSLTLSNRIAWFCRALTGDTDIKATAREFDRVFGKSLNDRECRMARWFTHETYDVADMLKKVFYPGRWRQSVLSEMSLRLLMLLGKV